MRKIVYDDETEEVKKGPWKEEEDEVLKKHVKKYGPRDWSSIRSNRLLNRTGKSCRLRWVNKLRPNLKSGVKFSAEEEITVIDLQEQLGNKWAKIATYLSGRTDNDVKNFWSSRQKRLARILHTSSPSSPIKSQKNIKVSTFHDVPFVEVAPNFISPTEEVKKSEPCSSSLIADFEMVKMAPLPELFYPSMLDYDNTPFQIDNTPEKQPLFPVIPQIQLNLSPPLENQEFITRLGDPNFLDVFGQLPIVSSFLGTSSRFSGKEESCEFVTSEVFMDDFPPIDDMFDQIEPLPSPSDWS